MATSKKVSSWWLIVTAVGGLVLGSGAIWEWKRAAVESARLDIEKAKASLEIRAKMNDRLSGILELSKDHESRRKHAAELESKIEYFNAAEKHLAQLEGRQPTLYTFKPPGPATNLRIE
jgi:hypothetical protein